MLLMFWLAFWAAPLWGGEALVAVASNFSTTAKVLVEHFQLQTGHQVKLAFGSTGKHYAQIRHGAPYDLFLAADRLRPQRLEQEGGAIPGSRFTYAHGQLALWRPDAKAVLGAETLKQMRGPIAIANPRLAPYGRAAQEVIQGLKLEAQLRPRLVMGENIAQTYQFVASGNAALGFVAYAQLQRPGVELRGSLWLVPQQLYTPIEQQAVRLTQNPVAMAFSRFLQSDEARTLIQAYGYHTP